MQYDPQQARRIWQNTVNNARGHVFEEEIKKACRHYKAQRRAKIDKIPEPFRVVQKHGKGMFTGRFTAAAEPDYQGTLAGGRSIVFEAKYTATDRMSQNVLTQEQMATLEDHAGLGAVTAVCVGIKEHFFFVPWDVWRDMKAIYGRKYVTWEDLHPYRVKFNGTVLFLDYMREDVKR